MFDYEFCNLFKLQEASILKIVNPSSNDMPNGPESNLSSEDHKLLLQYKELIREQDVQLVSMRKHLVSLQTENEASKAQLSDQQSNIQQLRDQIALLRVQKSVYDPSYSANYVTSSQPLYSNTDQAAVSYGITDNVPEQSSVLANNEQVPPTDAFAALSINQQAIPNSVESQLRQHIDHLNYELSLREQNLQILVCMQ